jgi:hypothetical protein
VSIFAIRHRAILLNGVLQVVVGDRLAIGLERKRDRLTPQRGERGHQQLRSPGAIEDDAVVTGDDGYAQAAEPEGGISMRVVEHARELVQSVRQRGLPDRRMRGDVVTEQ